MNVKLKACDPRWARIYRANKMKHRVMTLKVKKSDGTSLIQLAVKVPRPLTFIKVDFGADEAVWMSPGAESDLYGDLTVEITEPKHSHRPRWVDAKLN